MKSLWLSTEKNFWTTTTLFWTTTLCCSAGNAGFGSFLAAIWRHKNNTRDISEIPSLILCFLMHLEINTTTPNQANPGDFPFPLVLVHRGAAAGLREAGAEAAGARGLAGSAVCSQGGRGILHHPRALAAGGQGADHLRVCERYLQHPHTSLAQRASHPHTQGNSSLFCV